MNRQSKLIQVVALGLMTSAIALVAVEITSTIQLNMKQTSHATQCNNTCRRATAKAAAKFGRAIWRNRND